MGAGWLVCLEDLPKAGGHWRGRLDRGDLACAGRVEGLPALDSDVDFELHLVRRGELWHLTGEWRASAGRRCDRCNRAFAWPFAAAVARDFRVIRGDAAPADGEDEADALPPPGRIDLLDVLREEMWLAWDARVVCDADCKGLCARCGRDLNADGCVCGEPEVADDHPFAALKRLKLDA